MTDALPLSTSSIRLLDVHFEGYFMCRIATDPDPSNEGRGMSGYTMALPRETKLDQIIRLQIDEDFAKKNAREPMLDLDKQIGVQVTDVRFDGTTYAPAAAALRGAAVDLRGRNEPFADGPVFESRNNIVGNDDAMAFVIQPFELVIAGPGATITARDYLDPTQPNKQTWQFSDPATYARRISTCQITGDTEVAKAVNVFDPYGYFRDRRRTLERLIARDEDRAAKASPDERTRLEAAIQGYRSRIYQLEFWGDRVISKIQTRVDWQFAINGPQQIVGGLGGQVDAAQPWPIRFWFGGWDGDLLIGYARGVLSLPFLPD